MKKEDKRGQLQLATNHETFKYVTPKTVLAGRIHDS